MPRKTRMTESHLYLICILPTRNEIIISVTEWGIGKIFDFWVVFGRKGVYGNLKRTMCIMYNRKLTQNQRIDPFGRLQFLHYFLTLLEPHALEFHFLPQLLLLGHLSVLGEVWRVVGFETGRPLASQSPPLPHWRDREPSRSERIGVDVWRRGELCSQVSHGLLWQRCLDQLPHQHYSGRRPRDIRPNQHKLLCILIVYYN